MKYSNLISLPNELLNQYYEEIRIKTEVLGTLKGYLQAKIECSQDKKEVQFATEILNLIENQTKDSKKDSLDKHA